MGFTDSRAWNSCGLGLWKALWQHLTTYYTTYVLCFTWIGWIVLRFIIIVPHVRIDFQHSSVRPNAVIPVTFFRCVYLFAPYLRGSAVYLFICPVHQGECLYSIPLHFVPIFFYFIVFLCCDMLSLVAPTEAFKIQNFKFKKCHDPAQDLLVHVFSLFLPILSFTSLCLDMCI